MKSLAQTGHIVSTVYLVLVCKKGSNAILKSAPLAQTVINNTRFFPDPDYKMINIVL